MLVLGAGYLLVAFVSYLFTWKLDQDLTNRSWGVLLSREVQAENWLGKLGALLSHRFIRTWFGIASFAFVLWSFLGGMRILLGTWLLPFKRTLTWTALTLLWLPAALGFVFRSGDLAFLGGAVGYTINGHLTGLIGNFGTGALLLFSLGAVLTVVFDPSFEWLGKLLQKKAPAAEAVEEVVEEPVVKSNRAKREMEETAAAEVPVVPAPTPSMELEVEPAVVEPMMAEALRDPGSEPGVTDDIYEETEEEEVGLGTRNG
ncbi:MAG: DNA translocase FtsK 4TM domain-containing protein [Flavobacteriales bacterium]|nr:DNA translocase FtsK 4TM domain-containing protein [Flavobacteriales bacterium]